MKSIKLKHVKEIGCFDEAIIFLTNAKQENIKKNLYKKSLIEIIKLNKCDDAIQILENKKIQLKNQYYTPLEAFQKIQDYIPRNKKIWEAFTSGNHAYIQSPTYLRQLNFDVIATGEDFFTCDHGDIVVSNIPFSSKSGETDIKTKILCRLGKLKKPFMLLIPMYFLQTNGLKKFIQVYGNVQLIIPSKRIKFYTVKEGKKIEMTLPYITHMSCWLCWNINLERDVIFV